MQVGQAKSDVWVGWGIADVIGRLKKHPAEAALQGSRHQPLFIY